MKNIISTVRTELKKNIDRKTKAGFHRFFKEDVKFYGVKSHLVEKIAKTHFPKIKSLPKADIFALCEELFASGFSEEAWIASSWTYQLRKQYQEKDFQTFTRWINIYIDNWAKCDTFCNHSLGAFIDKYPKHLSELKKWTKSRNRWVRRASAVTLIIAARKGRFLKEIFAIADSLLLDEDDMVQKGYGWMLKAASQAHQKEVFDYVLKNKANMPRTALRYAIEKLPPALRRKAMEK